MADLILADLCENPNGITIDATTLSSFSTCLSVNGDVSLDPDLATTSPFLAFGNLLSINGNLNLGSASSFSGINFPSLLSINGAMGISGNSGPNVSLSFGALEHLASFTLSNTSLQNFFFINTSIDFIGIIDVTNNPSLAHLELPVVTAVNISISENQKYPNISLPGLVNANNINVDGIGEFIAPALSNIQENWYLNESVLTSLNLSALVTVGASLKIFKAYGLNTLLLPELESVGGSNGSGNFVISNSTFLQNVSLPELTQVYGDLLLDGRFDV